MGPKSQTKKESGRASSGSKEGGSSSAKYEGKSTSRPQLNIWPEWNDADINAEKWEAPHKTGGKEKGKSPSLIPNTQHFFDDPDGPIEFPPSLRVSQWKRPCELQQEKVPAVVDDPNATAFDLLTPNEHIHKCEVIRWIISQVTALWHLNGSGQFVSEMSMSSFADFTCWKPWEHVYSLCKIGKGPHIPLYNQYGKYVVRLYWMGCWRKITVDDNVPLDHQGRPLLPMSKISHELWPMLLSKALIKVLSLDYNGGNITSEFGDGSVLHCLTGWLPEPIPIHPHHFNNIWDLLKSSVPEFRLPDPTEITRQAKEAEAMMAAQAAAAAASLANGGPGGELNVEKNEKAPADKPDGGKDKKGKDPKKEKEKVVEPVKSDKPQVIAFVSYNNPPKLPKFASKFSEIADTSENLRNLGLSHTLPHPLLIGRTRSCPLVAPPQPPPIPAWKLIRQRKKKVIPSDEPIEPVVERPEQWVELASPYINYKVYPLDVTNEPLSRRSRSGSRSRPSTAPLPEVDEDDPNAEDALALSLSVAAGLHADKEAMASQQQMVNNSSTVTTPMSQQHEPPVSTPVEPAETSAKNEKRGLPSGSQASGNSKKTTTAPKSDLHDDGVSEAGMSADGVDAPPPMVATEPVTREQWVHWEDFCKCFKTLYLFHKPSSYPYRETLSEFKSFVTPQPAPQTGLGVPAGAKKGGTSAAGDKSAKGGTTSPSGGGATLDDKQPLFLSIDSLRPSEVLVSFAGLSRWLEPPPSAPPHTAVTSGLSSQAAGGVAGATTDLPLPATSTSKLGGKEKSTISEAVTIYSDNYAISRECTMLDGGRGGSSRLVPAILVAEPYSWKSLVTGNPNINLRTTGIKSVLLTLPAGRHVLRFHVNAPIGWHVHLCSTTKFHFGDEEIIMNSLVNESLRFQQHAISLVKKIGKAIQCFSDSQAFNEAIVEMRSLYNPGSTVDDNIEVFRRALYIAVGSLMGDALTSDAVFGLRALTGDLTTESVMDIIGKRNASVEAPPVAAAVGGKGAKKEGKASKAPPDPAKTAVATSAAAAAASTNTNWKDREPSREEMDSILIIQSAWKGFYSRAILASQESGTPEHNKAKEQLSKVWSFLEQNLESSSLQLLRTMFKLDQDQMARFPFYKDEWTKIAFADYQGTYSDQNPQTWFVVFRSVFTVEEPILLVPKLTASINTCFMRVIDNDTGDEVPKVFMRVAPYNYTKNQKGYTFFCEARSLEFPAAAGRWRMRLIGSQDTLPSPGSDTLNTNFNVREVRDYYIPDKEQNILRYSVKVTEDHLASIQLQTSKPDVYIELQILDNEEVVLSRTGKGHVVIPAFIFVKDSPASNASSSARAKRSSAKSIDLSAKGSKASTVPTATSEQQPKSRVGSATSDTDAEEPDKKHKYVVRARVLRQSWPLSESAWAHVQNLRELEKLEMKANYDARPLSAKSVTGGNKPAAAPPKGTKTKGEKASRDKSRPSSQQFETDKPHWILRFVSDAESANDADVKKDTERVEQIRAMKQAWEAADPGRAEKAAKRREKFLEENMIDVPQPEQEEEDKGAQDTLQQPTAQIPKAGVVGDETDKPSSKDKKRPLKTPPTKSKLSAANEDESSPEADAGLTSSANQAGVVPPVEEKLSLEPPPGPPPKQVLRELDLTPFIKYTGEVVQVTPLLLEQEKEERQQLFSDWLQVRAEMKKRREEELKERNLAKTNQLAQYENHQAMVDKARASVNEPREQFRQHQLEMERQRQEALLAAAELASGIVEKPTSASKKGKKSPKGSAKGSKKGSAKGKKK